MAKVGKRFRIALDLAADLHESQMRKGGDIPYVAHLLGVAAIALEHGATEDEAIAALLHDALEDQGHQISLEQIRARFGDTVASIVEACTDGDPEEQTDRNAGRWRRRKEKYIADVSHKPSGALLVSMADKLHNARSILEDYRALGEALWPRFTTGREGTLWYYRALIAAFSARGRTRLLDELERTIAEIEALASGTSPTAGR